MIVRCPSCGMENVAAAGLCKNCSAELVLTAGSESLDESDPGLKAHLAVGESVQVGKWLEVTAQSDGSVHIMRTARARGCNAAFILLFGIIFTIAGIALLVTSLNSENLELLSAQILGPVAFLIVGVGALVAAGHAVGGMKWIARKGSLTVERNLFGVTKTKRYTNGELSLRAESSSGGEGGSATTWHLDLKHPSGITEILNAGSWEGDDSATKLAEIIAYETGFEFHDERFKISPNEVAENRRYLSKRLPIFAGIGAVLGTILGGLLMAVLVTSDPIPILMAAAFGLFSGAMLGAFIGFGVTLFKLASKYKDRSDLPGP